MPTLPRTPWTTSLHSTVRRLLLALTAMGSGACVPFDDVPPEASATDGGFSTGDMDEDTTSSTGGPKPKDPTTTGDPTSTGSTSDDPGSTSDDPGSSSGSDPSEGSTTGGWDTEGSTTGGWDTEGSTTGGWDTEGSTTGGWDTEGSSSGGWDTEGSTTGEPDPRVWCGDAVIAPSEVCDDGVNDGLYGGCMPDCSARAPYCGDGTETMPEACDDGNAIDDDSCTSTCAPPTCGDWIVQFGEQCDGPGTITACEKLGFEGGLVGCLADTCTYDLSQCTGCGNGVLEPGELCDGPDFGGESCVSQGFDGGLLGCSPTCDAIDTSMCHVIVPECGNGQAEPGEACDGADLVGQTCVSLGYEAGELACADDCAAFDISQCTGGQVPACGNGLLEGDEACDGQSLGEATCASLGFTGGVLACAPDCTHDVSGCETAVIPACGNGVIEEGEVCDGDDVGAATCEALGFDGGVIGCNPACDALDTSLCVIDEPPPSCGNGFIDEGEACDGDNFGDASCESMGFGPGALGCSADCAAILVDACEPLEPAGCGDGVIDAGEVCDGADLGGASCESLGFAGGVLACSAGCDELLTDACEIDEVAVCGNGVLEEGEVCDGADLGGASCESLGYAGGVLDCSAACDSILTDACEF